MRKCKACGKEIPRKMEEAHDKKHNFQPYYTGTCPECYDEDYDKKKTPIFIGIDKIDEKTD